MGSDAEYVLVSTQRSSLGLGFESRNTSVKQAGEGDRVALEECSNGFLLSTALSGLGSGIHCLVLLDIEFLPALGEALVGSDEFLVL